MEDVIAGANDAAGGVEDELTLRVFLESGENVVEGSDFLAEIFGFAFGIVGFVGPTHPGSDPIDGLIAAGLKSRSETSFDGIVATDGGTAEGGEVSGPMRFAAPGHTNEGEAERLVGMRPHKRIANSSMDLGSDP